MGNSSEAVLKVASVDETKEVISNEDVVVKVDVSTDSNNNACDGDTCLWIPKETAIASSFMTQFKSLVEEKYSLKFGKTNTICQLNCSV